MKITTVFTILSGFTDFEKHKNDVRFVFTSSCLKECSCVIFVICVCFRIVVSNIYCVVLCFSLFCVPCVAGFSGLCIVDCPFVIL